MNKYKYIVTACIAVAALQACGNHNNPIQGKALNQAYDVSGDNEDHSAVSGEHNGAAHHEGGTPNAEFSDEVFVKKAAESGLTEVAMGQMGIAKGTNQQVIAFGKRMVADHTKAGEALKTAAGAAGIGVPAEMGEEGKMHLKMLEPLKGHAFDVSFVNHMVSGHQDAVMLFEKAVKELKNSELKTFATQTLPTLKAHRSAILEIAKTVK